MPLTRKQLEAELRETARRYTWNTPSGIATGYAAEDLDRLAALETILALFDAGLGDAVMSLLDEALEYSGVCGEDDFADTTPQGLRDSMNNLGQVGFDLDDDDEDQDAIDERCDDVLHDLRVDLDDLLARHEHETKTAASPATGRALADS